MLDRHKWFKKPFSKRVFKVIYLICYRSCKERKNISKPYTKYISGDNPAIIFGANGAEFIITYNDVHMLDSLNVSIKVAGIISLCFNNPQHKSGELLTTTKEPIQ